jgi:NAD(P)-dependent dehydrogenase (short-subunit alcohol dehydrogenase family)
VALVTGSARGLGRCIAQELADDGVRLVLVDLLVDRLEQTRADLAAAGTIVATFVADVAEREKCREAVRFAVETFGRLDILINCAGIVRFNHATDVPEDEWNRIMAVNLSAPFWFCQAAIPELIKTKGNIVNIASNAALIGTSYNVPYSASKAGLVQMTRSLAIEYMEAPIRINAVLPGWMSTEIGVGLTRPDNIDMGKVMRYQGGRPASDPAEVAAFVAFVASPKASAIHGGILAADRGATAG